MKAAVYTTYGKPEVVQVREVQKPVPAPNQVLVKVHASTLTAGDWRMRAGNPFAIRLYNGLFKIKRTVLGHEFSGTVESVGPNVTQFKKGDAIFGTTGPNAGAHAQYVAVPANGLLAIKPQHVTNHEAAAMPVGALTAWYFLQQAQIQPGQKVLIYGASGSVGTFAVQLAKHLNAEVTAVCSKANAQLVRSLGATHVIDYRKQDFAAQATQYHVIFDAVGKITFPQSKPVLKPKGVFLSVAMKPSHILHTALTATTKTHKLVTGISKPTANDLHFLTTLLENGHLKPVIERTYPLADIRTAHQHAESGHKRGNLVLTP